MYSPDAAPHPLATASASAKDDVAEVGDYRCTALWAEHPAPAPARIGIYSDLGPASAHGRLMHYALTAAAGGCGYPIDAVVLADPGNSNAGLHALWISAVTAAVLPGFLRGRVSAAWNQGLPLLLSGSAALGLDLARRPGGRTRMEGAHCARRSLVLYAGYSTVARLTRQTQRTERYWHDGADWQIADDSLLSELVATAHLPLGGVVMRESPVRMAVATSIWPEYPDAGAHPLLEALVICATAVARRQRRISDPDADEYQIETHAGRRRCG